MAGGLENPRMYQCSRVFAFGGFLFFEKHSSFGLLFFYYSPNKNPAEVYNPDKLRFVGDQVS